jgi:hypothetical protein
VTRLAEIPEKLDALSAAGLGGRDLTIKQFSETCTVQQIKELGIDPESAMLVFQLPAIFDDWGVTIHSDGSLVVVAPNGTPYNLSVDERFADLESVLKSMED